MKHAETTNVWNERKGCHFWTSSRRVARINSGKRLPMSRYQRQACTSRCSLTPLVCNRRKRHHRLFRAQDNGTSAMTELRAVVITFSTSTQGLARGLVGSHALLFLRPSDTSSRRHMPTWSIPSSSKTPILSSVSKPNFLYTFCTPTCA